MVENCLAATGTQLPYIVVASVVLIVAGLATLRVAKRSRAAGVIMFVLMSALCMQVVPTDVFAVDTSCPGPAVAQVLSVADTTSGIQGQVQMINVTSNDTPTPGHVFVLGAMTLRLPTNPVAGSTMSSDNRTATVPGEGVYRADNNGIITFTPDINFVGTAKGVTYSIQDTAGNTTSNTYTPIVSAAVCSDPNFGAQTLQNVVYIPANQDTNPTYPTAIYNAGLLAPFSTSIAPTLSPQQIDLDPTTPGRQTTVSIDNGHVIATYHEVDDVLTIEIDAAYYQTPGNIPADTATIIPQYTAYSPGCAQPAPGYLFAASFWVGLGAVSDVRLKTDIHQLTTTPSGIAIYSWVYKNDPTKQVYVGVLAQDVMVAHPDSVTTGSDGYYRVIYSKLGLRMVALEQYQANPQSIYLDRSSQ